MRNADPAALCERGDALLEKGKLDRAIAVYRQALQIDPDLPEAHFGLGLALDAQGKLDEAIAELREAIRLDPGLTAAHINLGSALRQQGELEEAIAVCRAATRLAPDNALAHYNLGLALGARGDRPEAVAAYREAIRLKPDFPDAHVSLGCFLDDERQHEEQAAVLREAIRIAPEFAPAHIGLGDALRGQGMLREALAAYRQAIRIDRKLWGAREGIDTIKWIQSDLESAAETCYSRGGAHLARGNPVAAIVAFRAAIRLCPEYADAHYDLAWCLALFCDRAQRNHAEAVALARRSLVLAPGKANAYRAVALAECRAGRWAESLVAVEQSMALRKGGTARDWFILALLRWHRGERDQARSWFERAVAWTRERSPTNIELLRLWTEAAELLGQRGPGRDAGNERSL
jgi:tetratricopeptide (TPR) repeat protein